uniref:Uncharacterized protein n=1 Tax=Cyanistes caeruleus TaxID=156563 RepID=A0A8C0VEW2_CYACU
VVETSCPVHCDVCLLLVQLHSTDPRFSAAASLTSLHLLAVLRHVVRADGPQEFDVIVAVVLGHLLCIGFVRTLQGQQHNFHLPVEPIVEQEVVGHADPVGFHGMSLAIIIIPNIPWKQKGVDHQFLERDHQLLWDLFLLQQWVGSPTFLAQGNPWIQGSSSNKDRSLEAQGR